jgi:hypothetical protein
MNYGVDYNKLIDWQLAKCLKKVLHAAWLRAVIAPIKSLHSKFLVHVSTTKFDLRITGQVCLLRYALNEKFDYTQRRIIIRDAVQNDQVYTFLEVENRPVYTPFFINGSGFNFEVLVPTQLRSQETYIRSILNKNKLPGKQYKIIYV